MLLTANIACRRGCVIDVDQLGDEGGGMRDEGERRKVKGGGRQADGGRRKEERQG
jgi:hypothetical protein